MLGKQPMADLSYSRDSSPTTSKQLNPDASTDYAKPSGWLPSQGPNSPKPEGPPGACASRKLGQRARPGSPGSELSFSTEVSHGSRAAGRHSSPCRYKNESSPEFRQTIRVGLHEPLGTTDATLQSEHFGRSPGLPREWIHRELGYKGKAASPSPTSPYATVTSLCSSGDLGCSERGTQKRHVEGVRKDDTTGLVVPCLSASVSLPSRGLTSALGIQTKQLGEFSSGPSPSSTMIANRNERLLRYEKSKSLSPPPRPNQPNILCPDSSAGPSSHRIRDISPSRVMREALRHVDDRRIQLERSERVASDPRFAEMCIETNIRHAQNRQDLASFRRREKNRSGTWGYEATESPLKPRYQPGF